jgi:uncharacterized protein YlxP (DUF503 family)
LILGTCTVVIHIPDSGSLKAKRFILRRLKDRIRNKFNVSVAEVDDFDLWQKATIAVAVVSRDGRFADKVISNVLRMIELERGFDVIHIETELR